MNITVTHLRAVPFCLSGARQWFHRHGLDWSAFVRSGIDAAILEATDDALALRLIAHAKAQEKVRGRQ
ncbi:MAG: hypothetical protein LBV45_02080 [Xanthomonadaceae bacterium]|jgi:hypothetical protein|nr:hypothetical protein [Xanthomonadaceae bacterium]